MTQDGNERVGANVYVSTGRRSPRIGTFALLGAGVGAVAMLAWGFTVGSPDRTTVLVLALTGAFAGSLLVGGLVAAWDYVLERSRKRRRGEQKVK